MKLKVCEKPKKYPRTSTIFFDKLKAVSLFMGFTIGVVATFTMTQLNTEVVYVTQEPEVVLVSMVKEVPIEELSPEPVIEKTYFEPCSTTSTFKSYMDYRKITNKSSQQYKLQQEANSQDGYRLLDGRKMIAIANYNVGDELDIELSSGEILETVVGDIKANTSCTHPDSSLIEMIVDTGTMNPTVKKLGNYDTVHTGTIVSIAKISRANNVD